MPPAPCLYLALLIPALLALVALVRRPPRSTLRLLTLGTTAAVLGLVPAIAAVWSRGAMTAADGWLRLDALSALHLLILGVVFLPAADAPVRAGPDMSGRVYVWTGSTWELSRNDVTIPEGFYIWDAGDKAPATGGKERGRGPDRTAG